MTSLRSASAAALALVLAAGAAPAAAQAVPAIAVAGDPQVVFRWETDRCAPDDFADSPARAFRTADGAVRLIASHMDARPMSGPDLDRLRHGCRVAYAGGRNDDPAAYDDRAWILSPYTLDGRTVVALVHNEFHGNLRPALCPSRVYSRCWFNAITFAVSQDGGATFRRPPPPGDLVMALPWRYEGELGRAGYFNPSNIVADGGWFYSLVLTFRLRDQEPGVCLIRTDRLDDARSWRGWDGRGFTVRFVDPYRERVADPRAHVCAPVGRGKLTESVSLVRHAPTGLWIALMATTRPGPDGQPVRGIHAAASRDMIAWSDTVVVMATPVFQVFACGRDTWSAAYPALLDPDSPSRNFETFGERSAPGAPAAGWLYMTRLNIHDCRVGADRDLIRFPVHVAPR
jgi:hypothetical protein